MKIVAIVFALLVTAGSCYAATCSFNSPPATLAFGNLDPGVGTDVVVSTTVTFRCTGAGPNPVLFSLTDDDGLYETGLNANRMRNDTFLTEFLPYSLTFNPASGSVNKNVTLTVTVSGTARGINYRDASVGGYSDTITVTVAP